MKFVLAGLLAALTFCTEAFAATGEPLDLQVRYGHFYSSFIIKADGTSVGSYEWAKTVLKESALEESRRALLSYDTSTQKAEITAAYTLKADGRRIAVPKDAYKLEVGHFNGQAASVFANTATLSVTFPEVAVGDTVVFAYQLSELESMFPGHYSATQYYYNQVAYDDVRVRFDYPATMWVQYEARGMREVKNSVRSERKIVEWRYANPHPLETGRRDFSVFDAEQEAGYSFSTFKSYAEIAAAYNARVSSKAAVTERSAQLATRIVKGKKSPREQARALYEWVATHITYTGNYVGIGAVTPRELPFVLDHRQGDCKDHATLLQALLAARGINSVQALVNSGAAYRLPKIPLATSFNHVVNYLPAFDLYADSSRAITPFGQLPFSLQNKPVLLVEGNQNGMKTPTAPSGSNRQYANSIIRIAPDGSASGSVEVFQHGLGAEQSRMWARGINKAEEKNLVKNMLRQQGKTGSGRFVKDDPSGLADSYHYQASFKAVNYVKSSGAFKIGLPLGLATPMQSLLQTALEGEKEADVVCASISADEEYTIKFPAKMKRLAIPADMNIGNDFLHYSARYRLQGNTLTVSRRLDDSMQGNLCSPQVFAANKLIAQRAMDDVKQQLR